MERRRRSSSRARDADEFLAMEDETSDERLDRLIQEEGRGEPAVRSVRISARADAPPARGEGQPTGGETQETGAVVPAEGTVAMDEGNRRLMEGLSPEQQGVLARAAEALRAGQALQIADGVRRPEFLPRPLQLGDVPSGTSRWSRNCSSTWWGSTWLSAWGTRWGRWWTRRSKNRRMWWKPVGPFSSTSCRSCSTTSWSTTSRSTSRSSTTRGTSSTFWTCSTRSWCTTSRRTGGFDHTTTSTRNQCVLEWKGKAWGWRWGSNWSKAQPSEAAQRAGGLPHQHGAGPGEGARASVVLPDGLTHRDLLELEALQAQALKNVEIQIQQEIARHKASAGGSGSYGTPQGGSRHDEGMQQPNIQGYLKPPQFWEIPQRLAWRTFWGLDTRHVGHSSIHLGSMVTWECQLVQEACRQGWGLMELSTLRGPLRLKLGTRLPKALGFWNCLAWVKTQQRCL